MAGVLPDLIGMNTDLSVNGNPLIEMGLPGEDARSRDPWMYYRRTDGWIVAAPAWAIEKANRITKANGMMPLDQYGTFLWNVNRGEPGGAWNPRTPGDEYRRILLRGGAREFPIDQIIESGWHIRPPYRGVVFPQLAGVEIDEVECPTCRKKIWAASDAKTRGKLTATELLARHESTVHKQTSQNTQLGRAIADATTKANEQISGPVADAINELRQQTAMLTELVMSVVGSTGKRRGKDEGGA